MSVHGGHAPKEASLSTELAADAPPPPDVRPSKLILALFGFGAGCGLMLAVAFTWTQPRIDAHEAALTQEKVNEVLKSPHSFTTLYVIGDRLSDSVPSGVEEASLDRVYLGHDAAGTPIGFAVTATGPGWREDITLILGYDATTRQLTGMTMIEQRETPGIGDKIEIDDKFVGQFDGAATPLQGVKPGRGEGNPRAIDMITGATISSRAVVRIINGRLSEIEPLLMSYSGGVR
jgi:electron transport complex protein RnfG